MRILQNFSNFNTLTNAKNSRTSSAHDRRAVLVHHGVVREGTNRVDCTLFGEFSHTKKLSCTEFPFFFLFLESLLLATCPLEKRYIREVGLYTTADWAVYFAVFVCLRFSLSRDCASGWSVSENDEKYHEKLSQIQTDHI